MLNPSEQPNHREPTGAPDGIPTPTLPALMSPLEEYLDSSQRLVNLEKQDAATGEFSLGRIVLRSRMFDISLSLGNVPSEICATEPGFSPEDVQGFALQNSRALSSSIEAFIRHSTNPKNIEEILFVAYTAALHCKTLFQVFEGTIAEDVNRSVNHIAALFGLTPYKTIDDIQRNSGPLNHALPAAKAIAAIAQNVFYQIHSSDSDPLSIQYQREQVAAIKSWLMDLKDPDSTPTFFAGNYDQNRMISIVSGEYVDSALQLSGALAITSRFSELVETTSSIGEVFAAVPKYYQQYAINHLEEIANFLLQNNEDIAAISVLSHARSLCVTDMEEYAVSWFRLAFNLFSYYSDTSSPHEVGVIEKLYADIDRLSQEHIQILAPEIATVMKNKIVLLVSGKDNDAEYMTSDEALAEAENIVNSIQQLAEICPTAGIFAELISSKVLIANTYLTEKVDPGTASRAILDAYTDFDQMKAVASEADLALLPQVAMQISELRSLIRDNALEEQLHSRLDRRCREILQESTHIMRDFLGNESLNQESRDVVHYFQVQVLTLLGQLGITARTRPRERSIESINEAEQILRENPQIDQDNQMLHQLLVGKIQIYEYFNDYEARADLLDRMRELGFYDD